MYYRGDKYLPVKKKFSANEPTNYTSEEEEIVLSSWRRTAWAHRVHLLTESVPQNLFGGIEHKQLVPAARSAGKGSCHQPPVNLLSV